MYGPKLHVTLYTHYTKEAIPLLFNTFQKVVYIREREKLTTAYALSEAISHRISAHYYMGALQEYLHAKHGRGVASGMATEA